MATTVSVAADEVGSGLITLVADEVTTVNFAGGIKAVEIHNRDTTDDIWFTTNGDTPVVGGKKCYPLPPSAADTQPVPTTGSKAVKLISSGTPSITVTRA